MEKLIEFLMQTLGISRNTEEYRRCKTNAYKQNVEFVKSMWIGSGLVMLAVAQPAFILALSLFVTFLSFAFLER